MSEFNLGTRNNKPKRRKGKGFFKRNRSIVSMVITVILLGFLAFWSFYGFHIGVYKFVPWWDKVSLGLDLKGGVYATYEITDKNIKSSDVYQLQKVVEQRLFTKGYNETVVTTEGNNRLRVEIPNVSDPSDVSELIGKPGVLEFVGPDDKVIMTGADIDTAFAGQVEGKPVVHFKLKATGKSKFASATQKFKGQVIEIKLDDSVISSPTVNSVITGGEGYIEGMGSTEAAEQLAILIKSGSLPVTVKEIAINSISATLGSEALKYALYAAAFGFAFILLFMLVFYRLLGLVANIALILYAILVLWIHAFFPWGVQLTLPGIAGLVLGLGMAVDANVVIFERIKDEYRSGKTLKSSVEQGFDRAFIAVWDGNVTTIITAIILWVFGTVQLKGFAISLTIGIICSMLTAITFTKYMLRHTISINKQNKPNLNLYNLKREAVNDEAISNS